VVPIVVDRDHVIIAGHTRYQALLELKQTEAMVLVSDMSPERANEWRIIDNRSSEIAQWDRDRLIAELRSIDADMAPFFDSKELEGLMGDLAAVEAATVDQQQIEKSEKELKGHFEVLAKNLQARVVFVNCQHCGQRFGFDADIKGFGVDPHAAKKAAEKAAQKA